MARGDHADSPMLVGLAGPKGAGKTAVAMALQAHYGFKRLAFADPVKEFAFNAAPAPVRWAVDRWGWDVLKGYGPFRRYLQRVGTEAGRAVLGPDVWVNAAMWRSADYPRVVFDDVRFANEADAIRWAGGHVVEIRRPGVGYSHEHETERPIDVDAHVTNRTTPGTTATKVLNVVGRYRASSL